MKKGTKEFIEAFTYEIAYAKDSTNACKKAKIPHAVIEDAENEIKGYSGAKITNDVIAEIRVFYPTLDTRKIDIRAIKFLEFDSSRYHGSGYYEYKVYAHKSIVKELHEAFDNHIDS